ncbi:homing endonuclease associated repeat-containing protein [Halococcus sp. AFM35]|uniref:homing endonuclease associated repeat-containing protein n=1 Tax=Halococcus sp. AFM35 TaxID=3421653 RepID=UPI003EBD5A09
MTYTDTELLGVLHEFADKHGNPPTAPEINNADDLPTVDTFIRHFGTWNDALDAAGFEPRLRRRSNEELLTELREFASDGEYPTHTAVGDCEDMASPSTYKRRFGSWSDALDAAGLPVLNSK